MPTRKKKSRRKSKLAARKQVAIAFPAMTHYERAFRGVLDYGREHGGWTFMASPEAFTTPVQWLQGWPGDGAIVMLTSEADAKAARRIRLPMVNLTGILPKTPIPRVTVDNPAVGRMVAEHLGDCGFTRFAFYGLRDIWYSQLRLQGFQQAVESLGGRCAVYEAPSPLIARRAWQGETDKLDRWLQELPKPVGLMAVTDQRARMVVDTCLRLGFKVPDDVAVVGIDNDEMTCSWTDPPLSSVDCNSYQIGRHAAALLDQLMQGDDLPERELHIQPREVVQRRSSDVAAVEDPYVARAARYVRDHIAEPFGVEALVEHVEVSRRWLEQSFAKTLHCTPHEYICKMRVQAAKQMLVGHPDATLREVAVACGFHDARRFRLVFLRTEGITPIAYRKQAVVV